MPISRDSMAGALLLAGALSACNKPADKPTLPTNSASAASPTFDVVLADYSITAPASIPAALATFRTVNKGKQIHQAALVRLDSGKTYSDFAQAMKTEGPPPAWIVWMGGQQGEGQVTIPLTPGNYVWYCIIPGPDGMPHMMKGMTAPITVTPSTSAMASPPVADIDVTMHDYQWDISKEITAGPHVFKLTTAAGQPHEFVIVRLLPGKTPQDMAEWAAKPAGPPPADWLNGIAVMQPGQVNYDAIDFKPGHYAIFCFVPDKSDGKPHAMHGMVKEFTVQ